MVFSVPQSIVGQQFPAGQLGQQFGFQSPLGDQPFGTQGMGDGRQFGGIGEQFGGGLFGGSGLLGLTSPGGLQQGFLGRGIGQGFGSLFGNDQGVVDFGGGNFFQSGQGFFNTPGPTGTQVGPQLPSGGLNFGSLFGSLG